jgi:hypothetical protein
MIEIIFEVLLELLLEVIAEIVFTFGWEGLAQVVRKRQHARPVFAGLGYAIVGALAGGVSLLLLPRRLLPTGSIRGGSLVLAPLVTGLLMQTYGDCRRQRGHTTTGLATFWGGAIFAFSMALVRFLAYGLA